LDLREALAQTGSVVLDDRCDLLALLLQSIVLSIVGCVLLLVFREYFVLVGNLLVDFHQVFDGVEVLVHCHAFINDFLFGSLNFVQIL